MVLVKTDPSVIQAEGKMTGGPLNKDKYKDAVELLYEEGFVIVGALVKRSSVPNFPMGVPLQILADWDPQLENADIVMMLRRRDAANE